MPDGGGEGGADGEIQDKALDKVGVDHQGDAEEQADGIALPLAVADSRQSDGAEEDDDEDGFRIGHAPASQLEEIPQKLLSFGGEDGFGVELDAVDGELAVLKPHDLALGGLGRDPEEIRQGVPLHDERMVARGLEG